MKIDLKNPFLIKIILIVNKFLIQCYLVLPVVCSVWGLQQDLIIFDSKAQSTRNCQWGTVIKVERLNWFNQEIHQNQGRRHESWLYTHTYQSLSWLRINIMILTSRTISLTWASVSKARSSIRISQRFELSSGSTPEKIQIYRYLRIFNKNKKSPIFQKYSWKKKFPNI